METPATLLLEHPVFSRFGPPVFRRDPSGGEPVMIVALGERMVALPLSPLRAEFGLGPETPDGRMLDLVREALDFVNEMRPGQAFPPEIITGEASWEPGPEHFALAFARLRLSLLAWFQGKDFEKTDDETLLAMVEDPAFRPRIQEAFEKAAHELGLPDGEAVLGALEHFAHELAYIEALRLRLLRRVQNLAARIIRVQVHWRGDSTHGEVVAQVTRLARRAARQLAARFEELDAQTGEVISALRNDAHQRSFIRATRDFFYRTWLGFEPLLTAWEQAVDPTDREQWGLLERTYQFLAPRYMTVTEWSSEQERARSKKKSIPHMVW
jgi:hypothetical protein